MSGTSRVPFQHKGENGSEQRVFKPLERRGKERGGRRGKREGRGEEWGGGGGEGDFGRFSSMRAKRRSLRAQGISQTVDRKSHANRFSKKHPDKKENFDRRDI